MSLYIAVFKLYTAFLQQCIKNQSIKLKNIYIYFVGLDNPIVRYPSTGRGSLVQDPEWRTTTKSAFRSGGPLSAHYTDFNGNSVILCFTCGGTAGKLNTYCSTEDH